MPAKNVSEQSGVTDFKKLYSSHIQENKDLQRRKSLIDDEKARSIKSLSLEEAAFLRKYDKYTRAYSGRRRQSMDAGLLRATDSRDNSVSRQSLARDFVQNEFPYSFETWHRMVDAEKDIIECHKGEILNASDGEVHSTKEEYTDKLIELSESIKSSTNDWEKIKDKSDKSSEIEIVSDANSLEEQTAYSEDMHRKRNSLTPIDKSLLSKSTESVTENEEILDLEELSPRSVVKRTFRRHSVTPGLSAPGLQRRRKSVDIGSMKLPSISEKAPVRTRRKSKSNNDLVYLRTSTENEMHDLKEPKKAPTVPKVKVNDIDAGKDQRDLSFSPRPTPNAAVFVCGDSGVSERKDIISRKDDENTSPRKQENKPEGILPDINASQNLVQTPTYDYLDTPSLRDRSSSLSQDSPMGSAGKARRRTSMGTTTLNLLVENTKGAARLRYIALLAREMEREEKERLNIVSPVPEDPMKAVRDCRYLRRSKADELELERADTLF